MKLISFVETSEFTKKIVLLLTDEQLGNLQILLCDNPEFGKLIKGSGGIRKIRWAAKGKGKSGGVRVLYYWAASREKILMLDVYAKSEKEVLSAIEMRLLRKIVGDFKQ